MQAQNRASHSRLAAAGFADYTYSFAGINGERNVVHSAHVSQRSAEKVRFKRKIFFEMSYNEQLSLFLFCQT